MERYLNFREFNLTNINWNKILSFKFNLYEIYSCQEMVYSLISLIYLMVYRNDNNLILPLKSKISKLILKIKIHKMIKYLSK